MKPGKRSTLACDAVRSCPLILGLMLLACATAEAQRSAGTAVAPLPKKVAASPQAQNQPTLTQLAQSPQTAVAPPAIASAPGPGGLLDDMVGAMRRLVGPRESLAAVAKNAPPAPATKSTAAPRVAQQVPMAGPMMGPQVIEAGYGNGPVNLDPWISGDMVPGQLVYPMEIDPTGGTAYTCPPMVDCQPVPCPPMACPPVTCVPATCTPAPVVWHLPTRIFGDLLFIQATGVDMAHAQQQDGIGGAGTVPRGRIGVLDPDHELGFRVGGGFALSPQSRLNVLYSHYDSATADSLGLPTFPSGAIGSLVHHPNAQITSSTGPVNATYSVDFQVGEITYEHLLRKTCNGYFSYLVGGRYGRLDQGFTQNAVFSGGSGGRIDTNSTIDFEGGGPVIGLEGERWLGVTRFFVYGRSSVAALSGDFRSSYRMLNQSTASELTLVQWQDDRIVPMLEYELGLGWRGRRDRLSLSVGYLTTYWFNAVTTPVFIDAVQADNYVNVSDTLAFDGLSARAEWRW